MGVFFSQKNNTTMSQKKAYFVVSEEMFDG